MLGGIKLKKEYKIQDAIAYYILGYKKHVKSKKENELMQILKSVIISIKSNVDIIEIKQANENLLSEVKLKWKLKRDDILAYATCIFYQLINNEESITEEKIVETILKEIEKHHPRETMKEANIILDNMIYKNHIE